MKRITRWSPDTCGCVLEYEWDDKQNEDMRTHSFKRIISLCPAHSTLVGKNAYDQVLSENTRKNLTFALIKEKQPSIEPEKYLWWFDANRDLQVEFIGITLTENQKQDIRNSVTTKFGSGKVKVL